MNKNIVIQEGGIGKQLTADKIKTNLVGGGTCNWVPEDETALGTKVITENGLYRASDDGYYGYLEVTVNGVGSAIGTDGDGDEAFVHTDPITGDLVTDKIPSTIEVIAPPTNPYGIYVSGQTIGTEGMVVKAYLKTGVEYGVVSNAEITLDPTTAVYDAERDQGSMAESDDESIADYMPIPMSSVVTTYDREGRQKSTFNAPSGGAITAYQLTDGASFIDIRATASGPFSSSTPYTRNEKTVYYANWQHLNDHYNVTPCTLGVLPDTSIHRNIAWTMIYGTITRAGSRQIITVSWPRPGDGKVLETTFEILVAPSPSGDDDT